jgi:hypothetical protein
MQIKPNRSLLRSLEKQFYRQTRKVFIAVRSEVIKQAEYSDPETLKLMVPHLLQVQPMVDNLVNIWGKVGGKFSYDTDWLLNSWKKAAKKDLAEHEANMRAYAYQRSLLKAKKILDTEAEAINRVIDDVMERSVAEGLSVANTRRLLSGSLSGEEMVTIENWEAQRIALTEVNSAGNFGSFQTIAESGYGGVKSWITLSTNPREAHLEHEAEGSVGLDHEYNTGLKFPGDPDCEIAGEVINCHCTYVIDVE